MLFSSSKIQGGEESVADVLRAAREDKKITIAAAAKKLAINPEYLAALESGRTTSLPRGVYAKTFLRQYSLFLGLNPSNLLAQYQQENPGQSEEKKDVFSKKKISKIDLVILPRILKNILRIIVIAIFISYLGYYLLNTFSPPNIEISQPADNLTTLDNYIDVVGRADVKTQITINGQQILEDSAGNFKERVNLNKGINTIIITAQNKYSRKKIITKQILVK